MSLYRIWLVRFLIIGAVASVNIAWRQAAKVWCLLLTSYCTGKITRWRSSFSGEQCVRHSTVTVKKEIVLTLRNVDVIPSFKKLLEEGKVVADATGRLRYPHGAPVGRMVILRINKDGTPKYQESTEEWFDSKSIEALEFKWPKADKPWWKFWS